MAGRDPRLSHTPPHRARVMEARSALRARSWHVRLLLCVHSRPTAPAKRPRGSARAAGDAGDHAQKASTLRWISAPAPAFELVLMPVATAVLVREAKAGRAVKVRQGGRRRRVSPRHTGPRCAPGLFRPHPSRPPGTMVLASRSPSPCNTCPAWCALCAQRWPLMLGRGGQARGGLRASSRRTLASLPRRAVST